MRLRGEMIADQLRWAPVPMPRSLLDDFLDQARRRPGRLAVDDSSVRWTYLELLKNSARVAAFLLQHRPVDNRRVLLFAGKSTYSAAGILGTWMAGWAYGCIDEGYPLALAQGARDNIKPELVLVTNEHGEFDPALVGATAGDLPIVHVAELVADTAGSERDVIDSGFAARGRGEDIAYFGFTSGTTGRPKTIAMSHRGFLHSMDRHIADFGFDDRDRVAVQSCFAFDPAVMDLLSAINVGGVAIMVPTDLYRDGRAWNTYFERHRVTSVMCVPGAMEIGLEGLQFSNRMTTLRRIVFTGDKVRPHLVRMLARGVNQDAELHNAFGLTEAPYILNGGISLSASASGLIFRRPTSHLMATFASHGEAGLLELQVTGDILFSGYVNPKTQQYPDNQSDQFSTGDLFREHEGMLRYVGRRDRTLKWWGHRIDAEQLEHTLLLYPLVKNARVYIDDNDRLVCQCCTDVFDNQIEDQLRQQITKHSPNIISHAINILVESKPSFFKLR